MKILATGGGTAGHVWPIIHVLQSLSKNKRVKFLYIGSRQGIERQLVKKYPIPFRPIIVGKWRPYFSFSNFWDLIKIFFGIIQSFFIIISFKPNVVFAKGGYVTFPILFWVKILKIPLVIHESDVVVGKANLMASKYARKICLGFPIQYYQQNIPLDKLIYSGIPINKEFLQTPIENSKPKLLITGGSQGSSKINGLISEILPELINKYDVWHICGERDFKKLSKFNYENYHLISFTDNIAKLLRDADLVVSRAGASTLIELAAASKPSIIVPLESAASDHQKENAKIFQKINAAVVLSENNLTSSSLKNIIDDLMDDEKLRKLLGHHAHALYQPNATEEIIDAIFEAAKC
ncbi:MAG: UDP-N-acetylglucosamine-N-acetylmuramyl- (pentapeptide) pyrophosphoryl-undecaprenol N- acetylglucosamine transferase [Berkelbacteria bacterium GW2011_GWB1_38_5]|uniref:UDP-N-acetylglucosamine--N-acetylmuramyl-(pentapeptide) pyrophosphoryl-undecaprenol N-acetylglucosamine transferase n=2 Tax=Candidatus Berkelbacteria TaxID=1618330 RepID=A0A0G0NYW0_9BACT|nr:MAG: UDP-N-acetylglucosamine-N-acetylmuramyl- (pentapeptide) pyrophosphoryl-undecaprenol N- acetylglucosamine transferase [Berkelbacteria bacterium GW2011_GWB1_38_5]KKQ91049.1 MAG: UDP-N-acetylglucosamine-N-acetylmuramyl- (pentapeptide) pyrophosphoryl-undecaprenol N- acetylglucosamine transferase [Berkelbacteria bacterium GW2011_GWA1_39_10]